MTTVLTKSRKKKEKTVDFIYAKLKSYLMQIKNLSVTKLQGRVKLFEFTSRIINCLQYPMSLFTAAFGLVISSDESMVMVGMAP